MIDSWLDLPTHAPRASNRLNGRVALVYGGGSPGDAVTVGQAAAYAYGLADAKVVVVDRSIDHAQRTQIRLAAIGADCLAVEADVTHPESVARATQAAFKRFGRIDILHNNVGAPKVAAYTDLDYDEWLKGMNINCLGAATTIRCALPYLLSAGGAVVTNVSSIASIRHTGMNYAVYSASKAALNQLTIAVAMEYAARGVRANAILPGLLDTNMGRSLAAADVGNTASRAERCPMKFEGDPWDVANAALYLASSDARYVNGHMLVVDGGLSVRC